MKQFQQIIHLCVEIMLHLARHKQQKRLYCKQQKFWISVSLATNLFDRKVWYLFCDLKWSEFQ